jgi:hypothetical protein
MSYFATQSVDPRMAAIADPLNDPVLKNNILVAINSIYAVKTTLIQQNIRNLMFTYSTTNPYSINPASYSIGLPSQAALDAAVVYLQALASNNSIDYKGGYSSYNAPNNNS